MTKFDRWKPAGEKTIAYRLFRRDLTELNNFSWNSQGIVHHASSIILTARDDDQVNKHLNYGIDLGRRGDTHVSQVRNDFKEVDNWLRLSTLVFAASSLELFIRRIVALSLRSDPGLLINSPRITDGIIALKNNTELEIRNHVKSTTDGVWSKREIGLQKIFGRKINSVFDNLKDLHYIQTLRNSIAHDFARMNKNGDFWFVDPTLAKPQEVNRLSATRLQNLLRIISDVAEQIETQASMHIGSFELMLFWHSFLKDRGKRNSALKKYDDLFKEGGIEKLLSSYNHTMTNIPIGRQYCRDLLEYYKKQ